MPLLGALRYRGQDLSGNDNPTVVPTFLNMSLLTLEA